MGREQDGSMPFMLGAHAATYGDLRRAADRISTHLSLNGCGAGTRVGICLDQGLAYVASLLAVRQVGAVAVLLAPEWTEAEKARVLSHSEVSGLIADAPINSASVPIQHIDVADLDCMILRYDVTPSMACEPGDAAIIYTSGTTGQSKGVILTEDGISANVRSVSAYLELEQSDSSPIFTPSCYVLSLSVNLVHAWVGASLSPLPRGLVMPMDIIRSIEEYRHTGLAAPTTAFRILADLNIDVAPDLTSVRYAMTVGQPLDPSTADTIATQFPNAEIVNAYGCTENSPRISCGRVGDRRDTGKYGWFSVGLALEGTAIRIIDEAGEDLPVNEVGRVIISGPSLMRAYWRDKERTAEALIDGWFHTPDLGYLDDDGRLHLIGRLNSIINTGNEKVSPEEVEKVLCDAAGVAEAGVYGVPDPILGEAVQAQVVLEPNASLEVRDLKTHCRKFISAFKVPRHIDVVSALPLTFYGKLDRGRLSRSEGSR